MIEITPGGLPADESGEALAVPVFQDRNWGPGADWAAEQLGDWLTDYLDEVDFQGKSGEVTLVATAGRFAFRSLILVGLGEEVDREGLRRAGGWLGKKAARMVDVATTLHQVDIGDAGQVVTEGFLLGQYRFDKYRSEPKPAKTEKLRFLGDGGTEAVESSAKARIIADAVMLARDLINEPAGGKPPAYLAERASEIAAQQGLGITIYDETTFADEGFGGLMGVAAGSHNPARMVVLRHEPGDARASVALVGKGIVFDSGGLSIKPAKGMETMKTDMSGAAAVFGAMQAIGALGLPVKVVGITPLTENMPGGGAQRPGDVLRPRNGKTVEVLNTDAEGRLVLADGLSLAAEEEPDLIVDVATLTGACVIALGEKIAGLFGNDEAAIHKLEAAAEAAGEALWPMPLPSEYRKLIDSDIADMKNTGSRYGGAISAALFLKEFVGQVPWAHLDIAGPARWSDDEHYQTKGGSGFGVRTLVSLVEQLAAD